MLPIKALAKFAYVLLMSGLATASAWAGDVPNTLKIAAAFPAGVENAWVRSWVDAFERVKADAPHGLELELDYTESVFGDKGLAVLETYAESGEYGIIWAHSSFSDEVEELMEEYPDIAFVTVGAGNRPLGGNAYLVYVHMHEPSYLMGIFAGMMTEADTIGVVGLFPADDINDQVNAYREGAQSVNPDTKLKVTFIESWYDPAKAAEAANAQIAAGADIIYQLGESFQVCKDKNVMCLGNYIDMNEIAPEVVPTSTLVNWEPQINYMIDQWRTHKETGEPYDAPEEQIWFSMAEGGGDIAPYHNFADKVPAEVKEAVEQAKADILAGNLKIEIDTSLPTSD
jgi:basic membrane lipoprotein Med (substrate-binding protein (PBP1-ABC) superfamily)